MEWISWGEVHKYPVFNVIDSKRIILKCDDGKVYRYDEEWSMAIVTHFLFLPLIPES